MTSDNPICEFPLTKAALLRRGIVVEQVTGGYSVVKSTDVIFKDGKGNVEFRNDKGENGIFIKSGNGGYRQVFMYKRDYHLYRYGSPRYHICQCDTIQEFMQSGGFRDHYRYANTDEVSVLDLDSGRREVLVNDLKLCAYCGNMLGSKFYKGMPLEDFVNVLKKAGEADREKTSQEVDIFGYVKEWQNISEAKRELENYTCEKCGYQAASMFDRRFIHVHHIDGDKLNNDASNLQCLCIRCHANIDDRHRKNFSAGAQADMLREYEHHLQIRSQTPEVHYHFGHVDTINIGDKVQTKLNIEQK